MELSIPPFNPRHLRDAFGCFATGVTVVTGLGSDGTRVGLTANSFTSVSLDPPLLRATGRFAINILSTDERPIADRFAQKGVNRFADARWIEWDGLPVLGDAKAAFACDIHADHDGGDHRIIVGRITRYGLAPERESLLYLHGRYRRVHDGA